MAAKLVGQHDGKYNAKHRSHGFARSAVAQHGIKQCRIHGHPYKTTREHNHEPVKIVGVHSVEKQKNLRIGLTEKIHNHKLSI